MKSGFKKGDYVKSIDLDGNYYLSIFGVNRFAYGNNCKLNIGEYITNEWILQSYPHQSLATALEKQLLDNSLAEVGKLYNPQTNQLEDILKSGDLVIAWDDCRQRAIIGELVGIEPKDIRKYGISTYEWFKHAIKFVSEQQYREFIKEK